MEIVINSSGRRRVADPEVKFIGVADEIEARRWQRCSVKMHLMPKSKILEKK